MRVDGTCANLHVFLHKSLRCPGGNGVGPMRSGRRHFWASIILRSVSTLHSCWLIGMCGRMAGASSVRQDEVERPVLRHWSARSLHNLSADQTLSASFTGFCRPPGSEETSVTAEKGGDTDAVWS